MSAHPRWPLAAPPLAAMVLVAAFTLPMGAPLGTVCAIALLGAVMAAVHHAEVIAHRVGEPFGTLVLALAVTVIEVALIVSMMVAGGADQAALARDTIFSTVMIVANGVIGLCLVAGSLHHHEQGFRIPGAHTSLATLIAMCTLTLVLPTFTTTTPGPTYAVSQLAFAAAMSLVLWLAFVFVQTVRHRDYFLPEVGASDPEQHAQPPSQRETALSAGLLAVSLVAVVGLAKALSPAIESGLDAMGAPPAVLGIAIALLVLLPETVASIRAAAADRLQTSLNLAYGSALASIGLTIPAVAAASVLMGIPLVLGLAAKDLVLLLLTVFVSILTLSSGRTHLMPGVLHLVIFAAFLFLALVP